MKVKFSTKSNRVKGLSFHSSRPWILSSLHTGVIQIWDYKIKTQISKFEEHEGPVRALSFHQSLPLFVSGGDDTLVKVWNYKQKKCLFTLKGHIDYVRTAFFHSQLPWILTASDDQTMRIWNYQSRACINIIAGHSHYVMCAQFHPEKNFIVSCALDASIRLWDFTVLRKRLTESKQLTTFAGIEIQCIRVLEGHERGINWVCFHPTQNYIASASDDRKIKLWKFTSEVAWEDSEIKGHSHNVSCVVFDPKSGNLISNSEDKTIRVWNIQSKMQIDCYKKTNERYWILSLQKNCNLLGSGHDEGFDVFSINKEKIPHTLIDAETVIFAQNMELFMFDISKKNEKKELYQYTPKKPNAVTKIKKLFCNPFQSSYYMVQIEEDGKSNFVIKKKENYLTFPVVIKNYEALDSCFVSDCAFAVLVNSNQIDFCSLSQRDAPRLKTIKLALPIERIFSYLSNCILIATKTLVAKFDFEHSKILDQFEFEEELIVRQIVRHPKAQNLALVTKNKIFIIDEEFTKLAEVNEKFSIKSVFWERDNLLFYTTSNHWKFALLSGETGILKSIEEPLHLVKKISNYKYLAFSEKHKIFEIECHKYDELEFKIALLEKEWDVVHKLIKEMPRKGKTFIGYLIDKDYSSIALEMVDDKKEKFSLAINSAQFQLAYDICSELNLPEFWLILGEESLKQGIYNVVEVAYQKLQKYDKMSFLFLAQGNLDKLGKMLKLAQRLKDPVSRFNNALLLGDSKQLVNLLHESGHTELAALSSRAHRLSQFSDVDDSVLARLNSAPLQYCKPVNSDFSNWPHNEIEDEYLLSLREE